MTTRPRLYKTEAIVLKTMALGEADRRVTLFTRDRGKLHATARGVRKVTSKLGGHLDTLTRVAVVLARGRSLDVITGAAALETFLPLKADLARLAYGLYVMELVDAMTPEESPDYDVYTLAVDTLRLLATTDNLRPPFLAFALRLLDLSGFLPEFRVCVRCRRALSPGQHRYAPNAGGVVCPNCPPAQGPVIPLSVDALKVLRFLATHSVADAQLLHLPRGIDEEVASLLAESLRHILERVVRSAVLLDHLRRIQNEVPLPAAARPARSP